MTETAKRVRRSPEERILELDEKIQKHRDAIKSLEKKKHDLLHPKRRKSEAQLSKEVLAKAKKAGLSARQIAEKLGVELE